MGQLIPKKPNTRGCVKKNDGVYTRQNRKTGKIFTAKICNPVTEWTEAQQTHRSTFGAIQSAVCRWIRDNKASDTADYQKVLKAFSRNGNYKTLRCFMLAMHYAKPQPDGTIKVEI